jgi:hypothetical protein
METDGNFLIIPKHQNLPSFLNRYRRIIIEATVFIVILAVASSIALRGQNQNSSQITRNYTTPTSSSEASSSCSSCLDIIATRLIVDKTGTYAPPSTYTIYIYDIVVTNIGKMVDSFDPLAFSLITTSGVSYNIIPEESMRNAFLFEPLTLAAGQRVSGQISFQVPNSERPIELTYVDIPNSEGIALFNLPQPSMWVSWVNSTVLISCCPLSPISDSNLSTFGIDGLIQNSSGYYYSGDSVVARVNISCSSLNGTDARLEVNAVVSNNNGFTISGISPPPPFTITCTSTSAETHMTIDLIAPKSSYDGHINLSITIIPLK